MIEQLQKQIIHILRTTPTPREIADNFLNHSPDHEYSHLNEPLPFDQTVSLCRERLGSVLSEKLGKCKNPDLLLYRLYSAAKCFELPIMAEMGKAGVEEFRGCISSNKQADKKLNSINQDIKALGRIIQAQPLSYDTRIELLERLAHLKEVYDQGAISISRQQETALQFLTFLNIAAADLINDFVLVRKDSRPSETYKHAFMAIVAQLLFNHPHSLKGKSRIWKMSHNIILRLLPVIPSDITPRTIEYAYTGE